MTVIQRASSAAVLAASISACAAKLPPEATFVSGRWAAVEALPRGTRVDVDYVAGGPRPLHYSFDGEIESVTATHLVLRTSEGQQRLLAERVLKVSRVVHVRGGSGRAWQGAFWGSVLGIGVLVVSPGDREGRGVLMPAFALGGAVIGFSRASWSGSHVRQVVYQRE